MEELNVTDAFQNLLNGEDILVVCGDGKERDYLIRQFVEIVQTNRYLVTRKNGTMFIFKNRYIKFIIDDQSVMGLRVDRIYLTNYAYEKLSSEFELILKTRLSKQGWKRLNYKENVDDVEVVGQRETERWSKISSTLQRWMHSFYSLFHK